MSLVLEIFWKLSLRNWLKCWGFHGQSVTLLYDFHAHAGSNQSNVVKVCCSRGWKCMFVLHHKWKFVYAVPSSLFIKVNESKGLGPVGSGSFVIFRIFWTLFHYGLWHARQRGASFDMSPIIEITGGVKSQCPGRVVWIVWSSAYELGFCVELWPLVCIRSNQSINQSKSARGLESWWTPHTAIRNSQRTMTPSAPHVTRFMSLDSVSVRPKCALDLADICRISNGPNFWLDSSLGPIKPT